jgi:hypothetical protein
VTPPRGSSPTECAGDRFDSLDICSSYTDPSVFDVTTDVERHRDALGRLAEAGANWVIVPGPQGKHPEALDFISAFGDTYF